MKKKALPKFKTEEQEREFWAQADSTQYINWDAAKRVVPPKLKPSKRPSSK